MTPTCRRIRIGSFVRPAEARASGSWLTKVTLCYEGGQFGAERALPASVPVKDSGLCHARKLSGYQGRASALLDTCQRQELPVSHNS